MPSSPGCPSRDLLRETAASRSFAPTRDATRSGRASGDSGGRRRCIDGGVVSTDSGGRGDADGLCGDGRSGK